MRPGRCPQISAISVLVQEEMNEEQLRRIAIQKRTVRIVQQTGHVARLIASRNHTCFLMFGWIDGTASFGRRTTVYMNFPMMFRTSAAQAAQFLSNNDDERFSHPSVLILRARARHTFCQEPIHSRSAQGILKKIYLVFARTDLSCWYFLVTKGIWVIKYPSKTFGSV